MKSHWCADAAFGMDFKVRRVEKKRNWNKEKHKQLLLDSLFLLQFDRFDSPAKVQFWKQFHSSERCNCWSRLIFMFHGFSPFDRTGVATQTSLARHTLHETWEKKTAKRQTSLRRVSLHLNVDRVGRVFKSLRWIFSPRQCNRGYKKVFPP